MTAKCRAGWVCGASVLWLLAAGAAAQVPPSPLPERGPGGEGPQRMMPADQRSEQSSRRDASVPGRDNRMSAEDRRQLRRDVHEAGRDLYPGRMSPGRRESRRE